MPDISTQFMGLKFQTPFIVASGQATLQSGRIRHFVDSLAENRWSGFVTKTAISRVHGRLKPYLWTARDYRFRGMQNMGPPLERYSAELLKDLKEDFRVSREARLVAIASIIGHSLEQWREMAKSMEDAGADALELNLGCPSETESIKGSMGGYTLLQDEGKTLDVAHAVAASCAIPVMVKLSFHVRDMGAIAKICKEAGAKAVSAINTIRGVVGIDIETGRLLSSDASGHGYISGLSGPMIRPFGLKSVIEIGKATDIPICGIGGIDSWRSVVEYIMAGAGLTQVCSAVMWHGFKLGKKMANGLIRFMKEKGYEAIEDFRGITLDQVIVEPVDHPYVSATIDYDRCNGCKKCYAACRDAAFAAIEIEGSGKEARVLINEKLCQGCGLCGVVCDAEAIGYRER